MTETQNELYKMIIEQSRFNGFAYVDSLAKTVYENYKHLSEFPDRSSWRYQRCLVEMRHDILEINKSDSQHKIVPVKHSNRLIGYKIADADELKKRIDRYKKAALNKWIVARKLEVAMMNNGQMRMTPEQAVEEIVTYLGKC